MYFYLSSALYTKCCPFRRLSIFHKKYLIKKVSINFQTINTVSEVIRGFPANQEYFSQVNAPSNPPR